MPWANAVIQVPDEWWDRVRTKEHLRKWWADLSRWLSSRRWTHMHTQTFRNPRQDSIRAGEVYCRYLAEHAFTFQVTVALWAVELHPRGHGCHIHSLWKSSYDESCKSLKERNTTARPEPLYRLVKRTGERSLGFSRLWPIEEDSYQTALKYALKYILKGMKAEAEERCPPLPWEPVEKEATWGIWTREDVGA